MIGMKRWVRPARDLAIIAAFLTAVSFLPPDTSLQERQEAGFIRYCVSNLKSPLIYEADGSIGSELALMEQVASGLGLKLRLVEANNIGRSFNPADWNISRGQCDIIGGGLADSKANRGFGTLLLTGETLGLQLIGADKLPPKGSEIAVLLGSYGLDRLKLSAWMKAEGYKAVPLRNIADVQAWRAKGGLAITSTLQDFPATVPSFLLPDEAAEVSPLAVLLWRGDTTFTRAFRENLEKARNQPT